jgi:hypothetical protein
MHRENKECPNEREEKCAQSFFLANTKRPLGEEWHGQENIKLHLKNNKIIGCELDLFSSGEGRMVGSYI